MADIIIKILTPATSFELLTLDELKVMLNIPSTDTASDPQLEQLIDWYSAYVSRACHRVFAKEEVSETWRSLGTGRIFLSHWPVTEADIESVEAPRGTLYAGTDWELEEGSGKLELFASLQEPIVVTYTGGYDLPDGAPDDLKNACAMLIRQARLAALRASTSGIRSISHKDSRVMFFDPTHIGAGIAETGYIDMPVACNALLYPYMRFEV